MHDCLCYNHSPSRIQVQMIAKIINFFKTAIVAEQPRIKINDPLKPPQFLVDQKPPLLSIKQYVFLLWSHMR